MIHVRKHLWYIINHSSNISFLKGQTENMTRICDRSLSSNPTCSELKSDVSLNIGIQSPLPLPPSNHWTDLPTLPQHVHIPRRSADRQCASALAMFTS
jgi:hypothetical protein